MKFRYVISIAFDIDVNDKKHRKEQRDKLKREKERESKITFNPIDIIINY